MAEQSIAKMNVLRWDAHACLPLSQLSSIEPLLSYHRAGVKYLSVNIGMDLNPLAQVLLSLAHFRSEIRSHPKLCLAGSLKEIRQASQKDYLSVAFDLEGALPLLDSPEMVYLYRDLGVRQMHLAYNRNNSVAGGCHDQEQGLTRLGFNILDAMNQAGIIVDCSHMSESASLDLITHSRSPAVFSHANPQALVKHQRNISNEQLKAIALHQGVVCLNGVNLFLGEDNPTLDTFLDHICYVSDYVGVEHVGIGLDISFKQGDIDDEPKQNFDPNYWWPKNAGYSEGIKQIRYLPVDTWISLPQALENRGFTDQEVDLVLGENMARILARVEEVAQ
ncbi:MAG: peptidase M19 [Myxococcales bacterium]|nr:peptidase M19 [Myxococcales bacterium]